PARRTRRHRRRGVRSAGPTHARPHQRASNRDESAAITDEGEGEGVAGGRDEGGAGRPPPQMAVCTRLLMTSMRSLCHGSGSRPFVRYANDTPESGSPQQYDEPTPPWPNVRGEASAPSPRMVSVVPRECGPRPRCIGIPMYSSTRSPVKLRVTYCTRRGDTKRTPSSVPPPSSIW